MSGKKLVYVAFDNSCEHWISRLLNKKINHCYIIEPVGEYLIAIEKTMAGFEVYKTSISNDIIIVRAEAAEVWGWLYMNTCVGNVKAALGIKSPFIFTANQLYRKLKKWAEQSKI